MARLNFRDKIVIKLSLENTVKTSLTQEHCEERYKTYVTFCIVYKLTNDLESFIEWTRRNFNG